MLVPGEVVQITVTYPPIFIPALEGVSHKFNSPGKPCHQNCELGILFTDPPSDLIVKKTAVP